MATYVAVFALILAYVALVAAYSALRTLAKLRRATTLLARGTRGTEGHRSLIEATTEHAELTQTVAEQLESLRAHVDAQHATALAAVAERAAEENGALRNVALVRYDAFTDLSGRMSFSLALLDDGGDGVTISAITGRSDTRVYAKAVVGGTGEHELSPEERQAVSAAIGKKPGLFRRAS
ncbi:DUF4446 family protein [Jatrophihabitans sp.]|uniref:DUF4446 family protein n=1 Tax=Jatrophihabitans sp. TaxID=1932789 RepID=UPI0030C68B04|nr:hypothetical protein [Jatrophihabitans sp.]